MTQAAPRQRWLPINPANAGVTPLELFFDLVFVFALTQVTRLMARDNTVESLLRGVLVLGLLWASWAGYAWLCNMVSADAGVVRLVLLTAMAAMLWLALSIPEAFSDRGGGLYGPLVVAVAYFVFRVLHLVMYWLVSQGDPALRRQLVRFAPFALAGTTTLLLAAATNGIAQTLLWVLALAADYLGTLLGGSQGWRLRSTGHFVERHGLIIIIALGESIVAIGIGVGGLPVSGPILAASLLGLVVAASLWWIYFDTSAPHAHRALDEQREEDRAHFARDAYSFLHLPLLIGIVLTAMGLKKVLEHVADTDTHDPTDRLNALALLALYGGVLVYLLGEAAFRWRTTRQVVPGRLVAAGGLVLIWIVAARIPALAALACLAALLVLLIAYEAVAYADHRRELRRH